MNILGVFLFNKIRTGGDRRCLELMESLAERGHTVYVLMNTYLDYAPRFFIKIPLSITYTYRSFPPASFLFREKIKFFLKKIEKKLEKKIDFIHIHGDTHLKSALFLKKKLKVPLFYASRCNDIDRARILRKSGAFSLKQYLFSIIYEPINRSREKQIAKHADLITFQNAVDRDIFVKRTKSAQSKTVIIPGNIGLPRCVPEWKNKNNSFAVKKIVYVGSLSASKGLWDLLKAASLLKAKGFSIQYYVLGKEENMDALKQFIREKGIENDVFIEGYKPPFSYLAECDLMVYPTLYDAYPDAALEALHTGCPVIASRVGGLPDLLRYPELLFESGNAEEIADRVERCITGVDFYKRIKELCAERAEAHRFDWAERFERAMADFLIF
jgi:glycosyltransferase involved in cell wall biosynthesis